MAGRPAEAPRLPEGLLPGRDPDRKPARHHAARIGSSGRSRRHCVRGQPRHAKLLDHYGIRTPLTPYHEHNAAEARPKLLGRISGGGSIALVSDAGTPLISDPGYKLVREVRDGISP